MSWRPAEVNPAGGQPMRSSAAHSYIAAAYEVIRRPAIAKLLESLERVMVDKANEIEIKAKLSIEHVMPQEWADVLAVGRCQR